MQIKLDSQYIAFKKVGEVRQLHTTTSKLDRTDENRALLGPWFDGILERVRVAEEGISQQRNEKQVQSGMRARAAATDTKCDSRRKGTTNARGYEELA